MRIKFHIYALLAVLSFCVSLSIASPEAEDSPAMDHFIRGTIASETEAHYEALFHFQEALRLEPQSLFIHVALAQEYVLVGQPSRGLELLEAALKVDPQYRDALELKAAILRSKGDYPEAIKTLEDLVKAAPEEFAYYYELLFGYLSTGEFDKADNIYNEHIRGQFESSQLLRQILSIYVVSQEFDRAVPYMEQLLDSDTLDAELVYSMGTLYLQVGDTVSAEALIQRALQIDPAEPRYWFAGAVLEFERENYEGVLEIADEAEASAGPLATMSNLVGNTYQRLGRTSDAISAFQTAIELDSTYFAAMGSLALLYDGLDSLDRVVDLYERAILLSDSTPVYMNNLAYTYAERGIELGKARVLVSLALEAEPENASYLDTMGWIEFQEGNYEQAVDWLKKAIKVDPESAPVYEHLGDAYGKSGSEGKARKFYRKALALDPENPSLLTKLGRD